MRKWKMCWARLHGTQGGDSLPLGMYDTLMSRLYVCQEEMAKQGRGPRGVSHGNDLLELMHPAPEGLSHRGRRLRTPQCSAPLEIHDDSGSRCYPQPSEGRI